MVSQLQTTLRTLTTELCEQQQQLFEELANGCSPSSPTAVATALVANDQMLYDQMLGTFKDFAKAPPSQGTDWLKVE